MLIKPQACLTLQEYTDLQRVDYGLLAGQTTTDNPQIRTIITEARIILSRFIKGYEPFASQIIAEDKYYNKKKYFNELTSIKPQ